MKAIIIENFGEVGTVKLANVPAPQSSDNEILLKIKCAAVNPVDWKIAEGLLKSRVEHEFPVILGWDAAGVISKVGKNIANYREGDEIFAFYRRPPIKWGTFSEYICLEPQHFALKPKNLSFAQAASIPLTALTAWQSIFDHAKLKKGDWVLIHAGAGGVGGMAIQLAKNAGARVITTASKKNHDYVRRLGAEEVIDYEHENVAQRVKQICSNGVDVLYDTVGGKTLKESYSLVRHRGVLVGIVEPMDEILANQYQIKAILADVRPNHDQLKKIAELLENGKILPPEIHEYPLNNAKDALLKVRTGHTRGKLVLNVS